MPNRTAPTAMFEISQWSSTALERELLLECQIPAGWVRVRFDFEMSPNRLIEMYLDTGNGFNSAEVLRIQTDDRLSTSDKSWFIPKPIWAIRLALADAPEPCRIRNFSIRPISKATYYRRAACQLLGQAAKQKRLSNILKKGLKAVATGDFARIAEQIRGRSQLSGVDSTYDYSAWVERQTITPSIRRDICQTFERWTCPPKISVLMAIDDVSPALLQSSLDSVCRQIYPNWELVVVAKQSPGQSARAVLDQYVRSHDRIKVHHAGTEASEAEALNRALAIATGDFTAVLQCGDELAKHALFCVADGIANHPGVDWIYSDEDRLDAAGQRIRPFFKPDWSPELALSSMYTGQLSAYRTSLLRTVGGWRSAYEGAHHYDLALRVMAATANVHHLSDVLYHARETSSRSAPADVDHDSTAQMARRAAQDYCRRSGTEATVEPTVVDGCHRVRRAVRGNPLVSVVIPTASRGTDCNGALAWYVLNCIKSIRERSAYNKIEIIVVDNNDMPPALGEALQPYDISRVSFTRAFNLSAKMNLGAAHAKGEYVVFMNDDIEILTPDWAEGMLEYAQQEQVGAVGVKLLFPNDRIQHAGVIWTQIGPEHVFYDEPEAALQRYLPARLPREVMAVTGACVMVKMADHHLVGGWNESLPLNFNDIDLCLKLIDKGRHNVYTPYVSMKHYESASRTNDATVNANLRRESKVFMDMWRGKHSKDPYYNPNFIPARAFYRIDTGRSALPRHIARVAGLHAGSERPAGTSAAATANGRNTSKLTGEGISHVRVDGAGTPESARASSSGKHSKT